MKRQQPHTHACADCDEQAICAGAWEPNTDGHPDAICDEYHIHGRSPLCEDCAERRQQAIRDEAWAEGRQ